MIVKKSPSNLSRPLLLLCYTSPMQQYNRFAIVSIDEIVTAINNPKLDRHTVFGYSVGVSSLRLRTFARTHGSGNLCCSACGLKASIFAVETFKHGNQNTPHINLYGVKDGEDVLFTHDHTLARGLGGLDNISNTTTMCSPCNAEKSKGEGKAAHRLNKQRAENASN